MSQGERRLAAIMFTDMVGYTALGQKDESLSLAIVEAQQKLLGPVLARHGGREVKTMGDAMLVEFKNALEAARCAYDVQRSVKEFNLALPSEKRLHLRVGIHLGDVLESKGDIMGDAVNVASRIEPLAEDGGVCLTQQVYDLVHNKLDVPLVNMGKMNLKNVKEPIEVYKMVMPWEGASKGAGTVASKERLAVLPFVNISPDPNDEFFADGLTEELISRISQVPGLKVIARTSIMNYKRKEKNISEIGKELGVGTIIEGSVRKAGNRMRVTVQLIDALSEEHLWASNYDKGIDDIFAIQSDIASKVADSLTMNLERTTRDVDQKETNDIVAYTYYLKAKELLHARTEESVREALRHFTECVSRDPRFAHAYVGVADCYRFLGEGGYEPFFESAERGKAAIAEALKNNDRLAEAHSALARIYWEEDDNDSSIREARLAVELNPNLAESHFALSLNYLIMNNTEQALKSVERAYELNPLSTSVANALGRSYFYLFRNRDAEAIAMWDRMMTLVPWDPGSYQCMSEFYLSRGEKQKAKMVLQKGLDAVPNPLDKQIFQGYLHAVASEREMMEATIGTIEKSASKGTAVLNEIGFMYYILGDINNFFKYMFLSSEGHSQPTPLLMHSPFFASIRNDPRYLQLVGNVGHR